MNYLWYLSVFSVQDMAGMAKTNIYTPAILNKRKWLDLSHILSDMCAVQYNAVTYMC